MISDRAATLKGVGLEVLILLSMTYALSILATSGFGAMGWSALGLGILFADALATPIALRHLKNGIVGLPGAGPGATRSVTLGHASSVPPAMPPEEKRAERQLLEAIVRHGKITPARAALETPLTVVEADRMLGELARGGHLSVGTEEGTLVYSLPGSNERRIER